jgi:hypothetical protein
LDKFVEEGMTKGLTDEQILEKYSQNTGAKSKSSNDELRTEEDVENFELDQMKMLKKHMGKKL